MSFGGRGKKSILPSDTTAVAGDHDFHVLSLTPSVTLAVEIKDDDGDAAQSYYRGECNNSKYKMMLLVFICPC